MQWLFSHYCYYACAVERYEDFKISQMLKRVEFFGCRLWLQSWHNCSCWMHWHDYPVVQAGHWFLLHHFWLQNWYMFSTAQFYNLQSWMLPCSLNAMNRGGLDLGRVLCALPLDIYGTVSASWKSFSKHILGTCFSEDFLALGWGFSWPSENSE